MSMGNCPGKGGICSGGNVWIPSMPVISSHPSVHPSIHVFISKISTMKIIRQLTMINAKWSSEQKMETLY